MELEKLCLNKPIMLPMQIDLDLLCSRFTTFMLNLQHSKRTVRFNKTSTWTRVWKQLVCFDGYLNTNTYWAEVWTELLLDIIIAGDDEYNFCFCSSYFSV